MIIIIITYEVTSLLASEHVPSDPVQQHHLLLGGDHLRLGELVEAATGLEEKRVIEDKLLDAALGGDVEDLEKFWSELFELLIIPSLF